MSAAPDDATSVRRGVGLFRLVDRGLIEVRGDDRTRWLDGMVSNDVQSLEPSGAHSGCHALRLDRKGRILADLHVWRRPDDFWLELASAAVADLIADLGRFIIADDVTLVDRSGDVDRIAVEGPEAPALVAAATGEPLVLAADAWRDARLRGPGDRGGEEVALAAWGFSGEPAIQIVVAAGRGDATAAALIEAGRREGLEPVVASSEVLEILRIEAGRPAWGSELGPEILPDEARLAEAISTTKGCYTGQEIVARLRSRGQVQHRLVGFRFGDGAPAPPGAPVLADGRRTGEVTSSTRSPTAGAIGLGYVRREHAEPGTALSWEGGAIRVAGLPLVDTSRESAGSRR